MDSSSPHRLNTATACVVVVQGVAAVATMLLARGHPWPTWEESLFYGVITGQSLAVAAWLGLSPTLTSQRFMTAFAMLTLIYAMCALNSIADYGVINSFKPEPMLRNQLFLSGVPAMVTFLVLVVQRLRRLWVVDSVDANQSGKQFQVSMGDLFVATFLTAVLLTIGKLLSQAPEIAKMLVMPCCVVVLGIQMIWLVLATRWNFINVLLAVVAVSIVVAIPILWLHYSVTAWPLLVFTCLVVHGLQLWVWRAQGIRLVIK